MKKFLTVLFAILSCCLFVFLGACGETQKPIYTYEVRYYFEKPEGGYAVDGEKTLSLTAEEGTTVTVETKTFAGYVFDTDNPLNVLSGVVEDDSLVLKAYYNLSQGGTPEEPDEPENPDEPTPPPTGVYTVTFDTSNVQGLSFDAVTVNAGEKVSPPEKNSYYEDTLIWKDENGNVFDFSTPITRNITLTAYEIQFIG